MPKQPPNQCALRRMRGARCPRPQGPSLAAAARTEGRMPSRQFYWWPITAPERDSCVRNARGSARGTRGRCVGWLRRRDMERLLRRPGLGRVLQSTGLRPVPGADEAHRKPTTPSAHRPWAPSRNWPPPHAGAVRLQRQRKRSRSPAIAARAVATPRHAGSPQSRSSPPPRGRSACNPGTPDRRKWWSKCRCRECGAGRWARIPLGQSNTGIVKATAERMPSEPRRQNAV